MSGLAPGELSLSSARVHYRRWGTVGPRVVLLHPIGFDLNTWRLTVPFLVEGYQLAAVDLPGHGASDKPAGADYSIPSLAARMLEFLDELGWEDASFAGSSLGGGVSLAAAIRAPARVSSLVLCNSVAFSHGLPRWLGQLGQLPGMPFIFGRIPLPVMRTTLRFARGGCASVEKDTCERCTRYLHSQDGRLAFFRTLHSLYGSALDDMAEGYEGIRCPALILHGVRDPLIPLKHAEQLATVLPQSRLVRIPGSGHFPQEEDPERTGRAIRRFLDETLVGAAD